MKIPLSWLREYVDLTLPVPELVERLTLAGLEVAGVRLYGVPAPDGLHVKAEDAGPVWDRDKMVIGKVLRVERHPNADKLTLATVEYGAAQPKTVVTGAPNLKVGDQGQKVILAFAGSKLYDGHAEEKVIKELKPRPVRGVPSDAMVCSAYELGISDEHEGIILLEEEAPVGTPLVDYMGDVVLEIDVLPNMARCLSIIGVAREVAALTGQKLQLSPPTVQTASEPIKGQVQVAIEDPQLSARYAAALLRGVKIGPAPGCMRRRLTYAGMRPISNIVDVTNYVMLEWGQPLHAFDYDVLQRRAGGKEPVITVRPARSGEVLTTLDGQRRELTPDNLVIADTAGPIALAGVMGGQETEVSPATTNVLLESANFNPISVRRTARALNLPSEASARFSRGIHPETVRPAAERAAELMRQHAGATVCRGLVDTYPAPPPRQVIHLELKEVRRILGMDFPALEVLRILQALEFEVEEAGGERLRVTVPPHRTDIQAGAADLIEELIRIHGYAGLPATLLADALPEQVGNRPLALEEHVRDILVGAGLQEVVTYSLTTPEREAPLGEPEAEYVRLQNPISSERVVMRRTVLAGVLEVAAANLRHAEDVRLFEVGAVYLPRAGQKLPDEPRRLALVMRGSRQTEFWGDDKNKHDPLDFFDLKGVIEALLTDLHIDDITYRKSDWTALHPGRSAEIVRGNIVLGRFGELHPSVAHAFGLPKPGIGVVSVGKYGHQVAGQVLAAELDLEAILAAVPERHRYVPEPRFPAALRDVAVIVEEAVPAERVEKEIRAAGGDLLRGVRLFDLYRGESIPGGTKSLAYALTYQAEDRTLTDNAVDKAHKKIEDRLKNVLKASIRGRS
jgi:phenylalanyl-tRNA synthetase beta chain